MEINRVVYLYYVYAIIRRLPCRITKLKKEQRTLKNRVHGIVYENYIRIIA